MRTPEQAVKHADYMREYKRKNNEKINAQRRAKHAEQPEVNRAHGQTYWENNKEKVREIDRNRHKKRTKEERAEKHIYQTYGLTKEEHEALMAEQDYCCAVCGKKKKLCVDHDHETDEIRGMLCRNCNAAIGLLGDTIEDVEKAVNYLRRNNNE
jgi:hypothetical protein